MDVFEQMMQPSPLGISASTLTSHMHVDSVTKRAKGWACDVRMISMKNTTMDVRRAEMLFVDGAFKKWPRGNAWADLQDVLRVRLVQYLRNQGETEL